MRVIGSLGKGLNLLEHIADRGSVKLAETAKHFDMSNSNMSIFMNTLVQNGYVYKDTAERRYFISNKIQRISAAAGSHSRELIEVVARDEMKALHEQFNENVMLATLAGSASQYVVRIQSNHLIQIVDDDEKEYPLHATANGKVILAFKDPAFISSYLDNANWTGFTEKTITTRESLELELEAIRKRGYAINRGEYEQNIMAVAAPISEDGIIVASLVVQYPTFRHNADKLDEYAPVVLEATRRISERLTTIEESSDGGQ